MGVKRHCTYCRSTKPILVCYLFALLQNSSLISSREGIDGSWSTFTISIGTPPQDIRLLPGTSINTVWPVLVEGCEDEGITDCSDKRGNTFNSSKSSTWEEIGLFQLPIPEEAALGYSGNSSFGNDKATFGLPGSALPVVDNQTIEGIATTDFFLGVLGLSVNSINITQFGNSNRSFLTSLKDQGSIPSISWGYTAGSFHHQPPVFGSLTIGGYDQSRFEPNDVSIPFNNDIGLEYLAGLQGIVHDVSGSVLLSDGIYAYIDSTVPDLWLPASVCQAFATQYGLNYNATVNRYYVNETSHEVLTQADSTVTFTIGPKASGGPSVNLTLHYNSFDLVDKTSDPNGNGSYYFPLRQAANATQYTLGRAFLQETYMISDWERGNFSLAQALFPDDSAKSQIIAIQSPVQDSNNATSQPNKDDQGGGGLHAGAIAGISIGAAVALIGTSLGLLWQRKRRRARAIKAATSTSASSDELSGFGKAELGGGALNEVSADSQVRILASELPNTQREKPHEMWAGHDHPQLEPGSAISGRAELPTMNERGPRVSELSSSATTSATTTKSTPLSAEPRRARAELPEQTVGMRNKAVGQVQGGFF